MSALNISGIIGSLNDPGAFREAYFENYSGMPVGEVRRKGH